MAEPTTALSTIAVGIDRSPTATDTLRWAADLATSTNASVRAIGAWEMPLIASLPERVEGLPNPEFMAEQCADSLREVVSGIDPDETVTRVVVEGKPGPALLEAARDCDLVVVGRTGQGKRRGISRFVEIVLGSTARHCIHHAPQAVAAVPAGSRWKANATVVVGVDGSAGSLAALEWALTHLPVDANLHAVRAFAPWVGDGLGPWDLVDDKALHEAVRIEAQGWVDTAREQLPETSRPEPTVEVTIGSARDALGNPGYPVDLIVVGERSHTGIAGRVLGSVADHLVRYATCPVIVVPVDRQ